jgi:hypothetical protein
MPKTYADLTVANATAGNAILASDFSTLFTNSNNYRVPAMCVLTAGSQVIANTTATALTYSSEVVDTDAMHSTSSNTSRITIATAGVYLFTCQLAAAGSGAAGSRILATLNKNGAEAVTNGARVDTQNPTASSSLAISLSLALSCAVNDYFEWVIFQSSGGNRTVDGSTFSAVWLGQAS